MKATALVSVVVAAYNAERTIGETLRSLLAQTHDQMEILVGDDASTDDTSAVANSFNDPRIKVFRNTTNLGPGPTRDLLIEAASGDFLAFVDADDVIERDRFRSMLALMPDDQDCLLFDDILQCHETAAGLVPWRNVHGPRAFGRRNGNGNLVGPLALADLISAKRLLIKPLVSCGAVRRLGARHPGLRYGEDGVFFWRLLARGLPAYFLPEARYRYRITPGSASASSSRHDELIQCLDLLLEESLEDPDRQALSRRLARLRANARIRQAAAAGTAGKIRAAGLLLTHPANLLALIADIPVALGYRFSRLKHGGQER